MPLVAVAFGAWYPSGVLAGLLLVPLTTGLLWAGLAWLPLSLIPLQFLKVACARVFAAGYRITQGTADAFARIPGIQFTDQSLRWVAAGTIAALICLGVFLPRGAPRLGVRS